jgi:hypothetical protein
MAEWGYCYCIAAATNYWNLPIDNGNWGSDYVLAGALMRGFWLSNLLPDAAYYYQVRRTSWHWCEHHYFLIPHYPVTPRFPILAFRAPSLLSHLHLGHGRD